MPMKAFGLGLPPPGAFARLLEPWSHQVVAAAIRPLQEKEKGKGYRSNGHIFWGCKLPNSSPLSPAKGLLGTGLGAYGNRVLPSQGPPWGVLGENCLEERECS